MRNRPDATELLEIARQTLLDEILPSLSGDKKYSALMIGNALAMAIREIRSEDISKSENALFENLYNAPGDNITLEEWHTRLCQDIRSGKFDQQGAGRLRALLLEQVCDRLALSNPKYLAAMGMGTDTNC